jgi:hypothetical protein
MARNNASREADVGVKATWAVGTSVSVGESASVPLGGPDLCRNSEYVGCNHEVLDNRAQSEVHFAAEGIERPQIAGPISE